MEIVYNGMYEFSIDVFHDSSGVDHLKKLKIEADEAIDQPDDIIEYADCLLALFAASSKAGFTFEELLQASEEKLEVVKTRKWKKGDNGLYQHI